MKIITKNLCFLWMIMAIVVSGCQDGGLESLDNFGEASDTEMENSTQGSDEIENDDALEEAEEIDLGVNNPETGPEEEGQPIACDEEIYLPNDNNQIIIEAEDHPAVGQFMFKKNVADHMGAGFLVYKSSDRPIGGNHKYDGASELIYNYYISESGKYTFAFRATRYDGGANYTVAKAHDEAACPRSTATDCTQADLNNDAFLGTTGRSPAKMFIGFGNSKDEWKMGGTFDINHTKSKPELTLKKGLHKLIIRGRSNLFAIDRIYIYGSQKPSQKQESTEVGCP